jgi:hypothetical protein
MYLPFHWQISMALRGMGDQDLKAAEKEMADDVKNSAYEIIPEEEGYILWHRDVCCAYLPCYHER